MPQCLAIIQDNDPRLRQVCAEVANTVHLQPMLEKLTHSYQASAAVGLAAPQCGWMVRVLIMAPDFSRPRDFITMMNPRYLACSGYKKLSWEGCLSIKRLTWPVPVLRYAWVEVGYQDAQGVDKKFRSESFNAARVLQHEMDHLDGKLMTDPDRRLSWWQVCCYACRRILTGLGFGYDPEAATANIDPKFQL